MSHNLRVNRENMKWSKQARADMLEPMIVCMYINVANADWNIRAK